MRVQTRLSVPLFVKPKVTRVILAFKYRLEICGFDNSGKQLVKIEVEVRIKYAG